MGFGDGGRTGIGAKGEYFIHAIINAIIFEIQTSSTSYIDAYAYLTFLIQWDQLSLTGGDLYFRFMALGKSNSAVGEAYARLYNGKDSEVIPNSEGSMTGLTWTPLDSGWQQYDPTTKDAPIWIWLQVKAGVAGTASIRYPTLSLATKIA